MNSRPPKPTRFYSSPFSGLHAIWRRLLQQTPRVNAPARFADSLLLATTLLICSVIIGVGSGTPALPLTLPNGASAGDVTTNSAVLWAHTLALGEARFDYGSGPSDAAATASLIASVTDTNIPVKVAATNLVSGTLYWYRVTDAAGASVSGHFKTPHLSGAIHGLRFGVSGDWRGELRPYPALQNADERNLDFFVKLGDTMYSDFSSPALPIGEVKTLTDFRLKHNEVYSSWLGLNTLADLQLATAIYSVFDDHEIVNDFAGGAPPSSDTRFDQNGTFVNETQLFRNGAEAFHEYNAIQEQVYTTPDDPRMNGKAKLYRYRRFGDDAAMILLDARSFRDRGIPPITSSIGIQALSEFFSLSFDINPTNGLPLPRRTMLGHQQLADLKSDLLAAHRDGATWKFVLIPEPIQNLSVFAASDRFEGYALERTELLQFITTNEIENVVFIAADIHGTAINNITYQLAPGAAQLPTKTFEVTTGSVAYDAPLGPTLLDAAAEVHLFGSQSLLDTFLESSGLTNRAEFDRLSPRSAKDEALTTFVNGLLLPFGYDPIGLEDSSIRATLLQGGYVSVFTYGWTEFEIDAKTQALTVTTFGIDYYKANEISSAILTRQPEVVSQFVVTPYGPKLKAQRNGNHIRLSWPASARRFTLQSTDALASAWTAIPDASREGEEYSVEIESAEQKFFRLAR